MNATTDQSIDRWLEIMEGGDTLAWADVLTEILDSNPHAERPLAEFPDAMEKWLILFLGCNEVPNTREAIALYNEVAESGDEYEELREFAWYANLFPTRVAA